MADQPQPVQPPVSPALQGDAAAPLGAPSASPFYHPSYFQGAATVAQALGMPGMAAAMRTANAFLPQMGNIFNKTDASGTEGQAAARAGSPFTPVGKGADASKGANTDRAGLPAGAIDLGTGKKLTRADKVEDAQFVISHSGNEGKDLKIQSVSADKLKAVKDGNYKYFSDKPLSDTEQKIVTNSVKSYLAKVGEQANKGTNPPANSDKGKGANQTKPKPFEKPATPGNGSAPGGGGSCPPGGGGGGRGGGGDAGGGHGGGSGARDSAGRPSLNDGGRRPNVSTAENLPPSYRGASEVITKTAGAFNPGSYQTFTQAMFAGIPSIASIQDRLNDPNLTPQERAALLKELQKEIEKNKDKIKENIDAMPKEMGQMADQNLKGGLKDLAGKIDKPSEQFTQQIAGIMSAKNGKPSQGDINGVFGDIKEPKSAAHAVANIALFQAGKAFDNGKGFNWKASLKDQAVANGQAQIIKSLSPLPGNKPFVFKSKGG